MSDRNSHFSYSLPDRRSAIAVCRDCLLPLVAVIMLTGVLVAIFALFLWLGHDMSPVIEPHQDDGEWVDPNPMRLCFMLLAFVASFVIAYMADRLSDKGADVLKIFLLGYVGGTMLWQSTGECAWHFSIPTDEYIMCFPHIEGASALIMVIVVTILLLYCYRRRAFSWGVWVFVLSFVGNWFGHFVQIGTYPLVASVMTERVWFNLTGSVIGSLTCVAALLLAFLFARTQKARLCCCLMLYFGIGIIVTGVAGI